MTMISNNMFVAVVFIVAAVALPMYIQKSLFIVILNQSFFLILTLLFVAS